jgi:hypothetical protein
MVCLLIDNTVYENASYIVKEVNSSCYCITGRILFHSTLKTIHAIFIQNNRYFAELLREILPVYV